MGRYFKDPKLCTDTVVTDPHLELRLSFAWLIPLHSSFTLLETFWNNFLRYIQVFFSELRCLSFKITSSVEAPQLIKIVSFQQSMNQVLMVWLRSQDHNHTRTALKKFLIIMLLNAFVLFQTFLLVQKTQSTHVVVFRIHRNSSWNRNNNTATFWKLSVMCFSDCLWQMQEPLRLHYQHR